jgi:O-antigen/teichoic acid export membrane protein
MLVSLYSVRVILRALGAVDYGIYNVVAGIVTMFSFVSGAMASSSQRYFSYDLGRGDKQRLKKTFGVSLSIYALIVCGTVILAETVGFWFVCTKLSIPQDRLIAAKWIYQASIASFACTIMTSPFMAAILAHEDMNVYAYISILEAALKLGIALLIPRIPADKLVGYGLLLLLIVGIITTTYRGICRRRYAECRAGFFWDGPLSRELLGYTGWNAFGAAVGIAKTQCVNIVLNQYFSPVVVAARGIAGQVNTAVVSFAQNFSSSVRPQIIKSYAVGDLDGMTKLLYQSSKLTYFLMYLITLPLFLEMEFVLGFWLVDPPNYAIVFTQLALIDALIESMSFAIMTAAQATGKIRLYQSVVGGILLLNLPFSMLALALGNAPSVVYWVAISLTVIAAIVRLLIIKRLVPFSILHFSASVIVPLLLYSFFSAVPTLLVMRTVSPSLGRFVLTLLVSVISCCIVGYAAVLSGSERRAISKLIRRKIKGSSDEH